MARPQTITVTAREGYPVAIPGKLRTFVDGRDMSMVYSDQVVEVPNDAYWRKRLRCGDVIPAAPAPTTRSTIPTNGED